MANYLENTYGRILITQTLALLSTETYLGEYFDVSQYSAISIGLICGVAESYTLTIYESIDKTNTVMSSTVFTGIQEVNLPIVKQWLKVELLADQGTAVNGALQLIVNKMKSVTSIDTEVDVNVTNSDLPVTISNETVQVAVHTPLDSFGRMSVSNPFTLFSSSQYTENAPYDVDTITSGTGSTSYTLGFPHTNMIVSASGDRVVRQSFMYSTYQPGKSLQILLTGCFDNLVESNVRARIGFFDDSTDKTKDTATTGDGFFFQAIGAPTGDLTMSLGYRNSNDETIPPTTPATQSDIFVSQTNWNVDKLDGTGPSGLTIDFRERQIFIITYEWLGNGSVRMGIVQGFKPVICHEFSFVNGEFGNDTAVAYMTRGSLPCRYEIEATGVITGDNHIRQVCMACNSEGGFQPSGQIYSIYNNTITSVTTEVPICAIRLNQTVTANITPRKIINILTVGAFAASNNANMIGRIYLFYSPTGVDPSGALTGGAWVNESTDKKILHSGMEYNITATALDTSGTTYNLRMISQFHFHDDSNAVENLKDRLKIVSNIEGVSQMVVLTLTSLSGAEDALGNIQVQILQ